MDENFAIVRGGDSSNTSSNALHNFRHKFTASKVANSMGMGGSSNVLKTNTMPEHGSLEKGSPAVGGSVGSYTRVAMTPKYGGNQSIQEHQSLHRLPEDDIESENEKGGDAEA